MKKIYFSIFSLIGFFSFAQIPNADFESWNTTNFLSPVDWNFVGKITRVAGSNSNYAVKMERDANSPGAVIKGDPHGQQFLGGMPINVLPDSLVGDFNYSIANNDTAWVLVIFKYQGTQLSFDLTTLTGNSGGGFVHLGFKNHFSSSQLPDTVFFGVTSTNPNDSVNLPTGGYMIADNLQFKDASGTTYAIPNGDFESWNSVNDDEPASWLTSNAEYIPYMTFPVTKTTDAQNGSFAVRIENPTTPNGLGIGYVIAGGQGQNGPTPGFAVNQRHSSLNGYFKFIPQNGDTATIGIMLFYQGNQVGWGNFEVTNTVSSYTAFSAPIGYSGLFSGTPDSAAIFLLPFVGGSNPHGNSVLYVDNLSLAPELTGLETNLANKSDFFVYPNPANETANIHYALAQAGSVNIVVYDLSGRIIQSTRQLNETTGTHELKYNTSGLEPGIYTIEITSDHFRKTNKLLIQK